MRKKEPKLNIEDVGLDQEGKTTLLRGQLSKALMAAKPKPKPKPKPEPSNAMCPVVNNNVPGCGCKY